MQVLKQNDEASTGSSTQMRVGKDDSEGGSVRSQRILSAGDTSTESSTRRPGYEILAVGLGFILRNRKGNAAEGLQLRNILEVELSRFCE